MSCPLVSSQHFRSEFGTRLCFQGFHGISLGGRSSPTLFTGPFFWALALLSPGTCNGELRSEFGQKTERLGGHPTSAIIGGFLVSFHWLITIAILKLRSFRLAGLILLFPFVMFLRWFTGALYWDAPLAFPGSDALDSGAVLELDGRRYESYVQDFSSPYPALTQTAPGWSVYAVEAVVQLTLILLAVLWFRWNHFRVAFWKTNSPPAPIR